MAEQFIYSSVLAPHMRHLLDIKASAGLSVLRTKWILKEIDDFANAEHLEDAHITESFSSDGERHGQQIAKGRSTRNTLYGRN